MHYVLSDFGKTIDFFPLCLSRPLSELRFGVLTIADQWKGLIPEGFFCYDTLPHLSPWYPPLGVEKEHVVLNGSVFPTREMAVAVSRLASDEVLVQGDIEIARRMQPDAVDLKRIVFEEHTVVELVQPSDLFSKLELVLSESIQGHIQHRKSEALHPSCCVIGKHPVFMDEGAVAYAATFNTENGPIYIGKNALVMEGSLIRGPFVLGESGVVKMGAKIYGPSVVGPHSKVGGELNNVTIHSYSNKGHDGYLGNAVIGQWCNLGANTTNSNLKNTFEEVRLYRYTSQRFEPTGLQFCGLIMGDHSKTAIGTVLNTGTVIGFSTNVFSSGFPRNFIPSFKWGGAQGLSEYRLDKAKRTAEEMMKRREVPFAGKEELLFDTLHELIPQWGVEQSHTNRVAFYTLGCKLNFSETSTLARSLEHEGYQKVAFEEVADVYVINTCSVTENADKKFRSIAKSAHRLNPEAYIVAVGCYAQLKPEELAAVDGVDMVLGAREKFSLSSYLNGLLTSPKTTARGQVHACEIEQTDTFVSSYAIGERTRAFLKVQDGCDYPCTYCTIPLARGISRSAPLQELLNQAKEIAAQGIKEIVLTGVNIGDYGKGEHGNKKHDHTFLELIEALDEVEGISRLRISSIEPNLLSDQIIDFVAQSKNFVPHFHIPLQSGSDTLLKRMKRRYLTKLYRQRIERIRSIMPDACIGVDVIVGFPGETDELFLETYQFLLDLEVSYLHVFTYSERENTPAATMEGVVPHEVRKKRSKMLRSLSEKKKRQFYEQHLGTSREVLFEKEINEGYAEGFTENYIRVRTPWDPALSNAIQKIAIDRIDEKGFARIKQAVV